MLRSSPLCLKRIPGTTDVLVIWNQISPWEAMIGLYRHRLSCAISKDGGLTWQHPKNLIALDDVSHLAPDPLQYHLSGKPAQPVDRSRYHRAPGPLRNDHPYCTFCDGNAIIVYGSGVLGDRGVIDKTYGMEYAAVGATFGFAPNTKKANSVLGCNRMHIVPIEWFYC